MPDQSERNEKHALSVLSTAVSYIRVHIRDFEQYKTSCPKFRPMKQCTHLFNKSTTCEWPFCPLDKKEA